jgi:hypothetical protein
MTVGAFTLIVPYYRNPVMLREQIKAWEDYPDAVSIILVDDGSPEPALEVVREHAPAALLPRLTLYRIDVDIPWNRGGARNLGAKAGGDRLDPARRYRPRPAADLRRAASSVRGRTEKLVSVRALPERLRRRDPEKGRDSRRGRVREDSPAHRLVPRHARAVLAGRRLRRGLQRLPRRRLAVPEGARARGRAGNGAARLPPDRVDEINGEGRLGLGAES